MAMTVEQMLKKIGEIRSKCEKLADVGGAEFNVSRPLLQEAEQVLAHAQRKLFASTAPEGQVINPYGGRLR